MLYLNKLLCKIQENPLIFKSQDIILTLGLTSTQIKDLKKYALENQLITQSKTETTLTPKGEEFLKTNPLQSWANKDFPQRPDINVESLKEEKSPSTLTRAIRLLAKHLIEKEELKSFSLENALLEDIQRCKKLASEIENDILCGKRKNLNDIFNKYYSKGITKALTAIILLSILSNNLDKTAIYEKSQFQLKFDPLMFDRMIACPENFEIQKTEMEDEYILKDVSKIILNKKSNNILEITKGLYSTIKELDKYTMNTQNLNKETIRFRNVILNAKDPISLFEKDIPKALGFKSLNECDRIFLDKLKKSLYELKKCTENLVKELENFIYNSFKTSSKEDLCERFLLIKEFIGEKELKILLNSVIEIDVNNDLWVKRIATYINQSRVPKDWTDEDFADFKIKTKELALKFFVLEATVGTNESSITKNFHKVLNSFLNLSKQEQMILLRKVVNSSDNL